MAFEGHGAEILSGLPSALSPEASHLAGCAAWSVNAGQVDVCLGVQREAANCDCRPQVQEGLQAHPWWPPDLRSPSALMSGLLRPFICTAEASELQAGP